MNDAERRQLARTMARPLADLEEELALYAPAGRGPVAVWDNIAGPLRQRVCQEWGWCQVRQDARFENDLDLAVAVLGVLSARVLDLPLDVDLLLVAAILVKRGLDAFCDCPG